MKCTKKTKLISLLATLIILGLVFAFLLYKESKNITAPKCENCNVILILVDALRADHLPCYGYYRNTAPHICELAKEGILFKNAFSQSANTFPSHMSIFTSLYPSSHGVKNIFKDKLDENILTLPQILKLYDYTTIWFGPLEDPALDFEAGFGRGIDKKMNPVFRNNKCNNSELFMWLENQKKEGNKFFMFYHTYQVHVPYTPKVNLFNNNFNTRQNLYYQFYKKQLESVKEQFYKDPERFFSILNISDDNLKKRIINPTFWDSDNISEYSVIWENTKSLQKERILLPEFEIFWEGINKSDADEIAYVTSLYDSEIVYADICLNEFFDKLKEEGFYDKTIILVTADHGEEFMEHEDIDHSQLYDEVVHVPLILKIPKSKKMEIDKLIESVDIMPTIISLLGIPLPFYVQGKNLLNNEDKTFIYSEWNNKNLLRSKRWSFIIADNGDVELYDLIKDSKQTKNIAQEKTKVTENMKTELKKWSDAQPRYYKQVYDFESGVSNETRENIIKTGYW